MVEFSQHVKADFSANAEEIMIERKLMQHITLQEGFDSRGVAFLFKDDPKHWIVCSHHQGGGAAGRFTVSSMPKRLYSLDDAKAVFGRALGR